MSARAASPPTTVAELTGMLGRVAIIGVLS
jgi:hypothetical protein